MSVWIHHCTYRTVLVLMHGLWLQLVMEYRSINYPVVIWRLSTIKRNIREIKEIIIWISKYILRFYLVTCSECDFKNVKPWKTSKLNSYKVKRLEEGSVRPTSYWMHKRYWYGIRVQDEKHAAGMPSDCTCKASVPDTSSWITEFPNEMHKCNRFMQLC